MAGVLSKIIELSGERDGSRRFYCEKQIYYKRNDCKTESYVCKFKRGKYKCPFSFKKNTLGECEPLPSPDHSRYHEPPEKVLEIEKFIAELRNEAAENVDETPARILRKVSLKHKEVASEISKKRAEHIIIEAKMKVWVQAPETLEKLADMLLGHDSFMKGFCKAHVTVKDQTANAILFIHDPMLENLNAAEKLFVDGVFKVIPQKPDATQLWIIHTQKKGQDETFPAVFAYCKGATAELYEAILKKIMELAPQMKENLKIVCTDFEKAVLKALKKTVPHVKIQGCWFHYCQAITKYWGEKLKLNGTRSKRKTNKASFEKLKESPSEGVIRRPPQTILWLAKNLALLPGNKMVEGLELIAKTMQGHVEEWPRLKKFLRYLRHEWCNPKKVEILSNFGAPDRTNNKAEAFNRHFLNEIGGKNPHLMVFLWNLDKIARSYSIDVDRLEKFKNKKQSNRNVRHEKFMYIKKKQDQLEERKLSVEAFMFEVMDEATQDAVIVEMLRFNDNNYLDDVRFIEVSINSDLSKILTEPYQRERKELDYGSKPLKKKRKFE